MLKFAEVLMRYMKEKNNIIHKQQQLHAQASVCTRQTIADLNLHCNIS